MHNKLLQKMLHSEIAENIKDKVHQIEETLKDKLYVSNEQKKMAELSIRSKFDGIKDKNVERLAIASAEIYRLKSHLSDLVDKGKDLVVRMEKKVEHVIKPSGMKR